MGQVIETFLTEPAAIFNTFIPDQKNIDWVANIADMHTKFKINPVVRKLDNEGLNSLLKFRLDFLAEELIEAYKAAGYQVALTCTGVVDQTWKQTCAEDVVDAMIDLCVVAIGTLNVFDIDAYEAWNRVHHKNMQKEVGINPNRPNPLGLPDLTKPAGWQAPTHADNVGLLSRIF